MNNPVKMVSRNLTDVFVLMRNNAIHNKQIFLEQGNESECARLMSPGSLRDAENGFGNAISSPPPWTDTLEEAHYILSRLNVKIAELQIVQERQIRRPALDDTSDRQSIERLATDIGKQFTNAHRNCAAIRGYCTQGTKTEQKLANNVVMALVTALQELSLTFRNAQAHYLKSITSREQQSKALLELPNFEELSLTDTTSINLPSTSNMDFEEQNIDSMFGRHFNDQILLKDNTKMVEERESEVNKIVNSIVELNDVFKDLAHLVHDQGTVLDRIDYNIEQTQYQVSEGFKQLKKADRYHKRNRKMHCILVLAVMVVVLALLLVIVKS